MSKASELEQQARKLRSLNEAFKWALCQTPRVLPDEVEFGFRVGPSTER
jgi:hypothetical protein